MNGLCIIADDLTGASDSGVQLARQDYNTFVVFDPEKLEAELIPDVMVMDTDSRSAPKEEAYQKVKVASESAKRMGFELIFKKVDSTLRGNIGREIDGVLDTFSFDFAVIAPAFPRIGRTTRQGVHLLHEVPISETEIARDPKTPVKESELTKLLGQQSTRKSRLITLDHLHLGQSYILELLQDCKKKGEELIVMDAEKEEDLRDIVHFISASSFRILWVGSAGLAEYMPLLLGEPKKTKPRVHRPIPSLPVMLVAGSLSKVTKQQVHYFNQQPHVIPIEFNPVAVLDYKLWEMEKSRCREAVEAALEQGKDVSLFVGTSEEQLAQTSDPLIQREFKHQISLRIADSLGELASGMLMKHSLQGVIMTGGDTAKAICRQLGVSGIQLLDEVEDGIPLSQLLGQKEILAVTKAGAFGKEKSLVHAMQTMKGASGDE